jgi:transmembrane sensor
MAEAASRLAVEFEPQALARLQRRVAGGVERRQRNARLLRFALAAAVLLVVSGGAWRMRQHVLASNVASMPTANGLRDPTELVLPDGSSVELGSSTVLSQRPSDGDSSVVFDLERGQARFSVTPRVARTSPFRVVAGPVTVEVVGTIFTVVRDAVSVRVEVERGTVHALRGSELRVLNRGEVYTFALRAGAPSEASATPAPTPPLARAHQHGPEKASPEWRTLARDGEFEAAYAALKTASPRDDPADLLLQADVARWSGHPREAISPLRSVMTRHASDPRAPLAAFTLGRVLLEEIGDPAGAARAFASARDLGHGGPLEESALAREAEAWYRAGELGKARTLAEEYLRRYPNGEKVKLLRRYVGP